MKGAALLLTLSAALGCDGFVGEATMKTPALARPKVTALERARDVLARRRSDGVIGNIPLAGFNFDREMEIGDGLHVIVISCNLEGGLAVFRRDGTALATQRTKEITAVQLVDLDEDGVSEVVTEEIDGRGTGVLEKTFRVYRIDGSGVQELWSGESYVRHAPDEQHVEETVGFIRFDASGAGKNARLTHVLIDPSHHERIMTFEWTDGHLVKTY